MGREIDELIRRRILEFVGYGKGFKSTQEIFDYLGWNINNVQDNSKWYQLVKREKESFHKEILNQNLNALFNGDREFVYKKCLENWYLKRRLLLYKHPEGWETPKTLATKEKIEQLELAKQIDGIVEKTMRMHNLQEVIPYDEETIKALKDQLSDYIETLDEEKIIKETESKKLNEITYNELEKEAEK